MQATDPYTVRSACLDGALGFLFPLMLSCVYRYGLVEPVETGSTGIAGGAEDDSPAVGGGT